MSKEYKGKSWNNTPQSHIHKHFEPQPMDSYEYHLLDFPEEINISIKTKVGEFKVVCKNCNSELTELNYCPICGYINPTDNTQD